MKSIKASLKLTALVIHTLFMYGCFAAGYGFLSLLGAKTGNWRNFWLQGWGKGALKILSIRARVCGSPPDPPFFLVSNHLSYLDIIVLFSLVKTTFISKAEVRHWPVLGFMAHTLGILFISRRNKMDVARVNTEVAGQIDRFKGVVLFPEGKTTSGDSVLPFKPSLLEHPATSDLPVHHCVLSYQTSAGEPPARDRVYWWNDEPFGEHIFNFAKLKGTEVTVRFGQDPVHSSDRKELAEELHRQVEQAYRSHLAEQSGQSFAGINS